MGPPPSTRPWPLANATSPAGRGTIEQGGWIGPGRGASCLHPQALGLAQPPQAPPKQTAAGAGSGGRRPRPLCAANHHADVKVLVLCLLCFVRFVTMLRLQAKVPLGWGGENPANRDPRGEEFVPGPFEFWRPILFDA